ncbi:hypothetical protein AIOL_001346 [Candidatus Rhodobacter oscarellae]|uniref:Uncharacterized protein n=1 Tax=Candidatus Rhodobacter oscarellae TaxID=1675527 RepID=A0A0J9E3J6_9RHOB|nr:hypothetical protein [Candidatus Rhodobacter lobularis]KMW56394.1 hypothetical protein AIOL_001346 [Candidatus Rhodobacter lobularis]
MPTFEENFKFDSSPFEQYVAENEPDILDYAVVPPYFEVAKKRALTPSTHLLFGARGGGKSATRLATERELWKLHADGVNVPLAVPYIDFSRVLERGTVNKISSDDLLKELSFRVIETLLLWISDQDSAEDIVELLVPEELNLMVVLVQAFYLRVPEANRRVSQAQAMAILRQNWKSRTANWIQKKWSAITEIVSEVASGLSEKHADTESMKSQVAEMFNENGAIISGTALLAKLVEVARVFGFSGVSVFVDKVDEHPVTQNSPESSARLIFPLLSHVQLMEVEGLGWQFFLWDRVKAIFADGELSVRLDKLAHSEVSWTVEFLRKMIDSRVSFFSSKCLSSFSELGADETVTHEKIGEIIDLAVKSPRETIRLLDTVVREFDSKYSAQEGHRYLEAEDLENGMDKYVSDVIWSVYDKEVLSQILRLNKSTFINKEVQAAFKISAPGATNRIVKWQDAGAISQSGKREAEGGVGGKPSNEYSIADPRIVRLMERKLYDEKVLTEAPIEAEE